MATHTTLTSLFSAIANKIRSYTGGSADIIADNFPSAIDAVYNAGLANGQGTGETPTQFTNLAKNATVKKDYRINSAGGFSATTGSTILSFKNPKVGQACTLYFRGALMNNGTQNIAAGTSSGAGTKMITTDIASAANQNEQGDLYVSIPADASLTWIHFCILGYVDKRRPIIAIDEYIGNGGFVES